MSLYEIPTDRWQFDDTNADRRDIQKIFTPSIRGAQNTSFDPRTQLLGLKCRSRL
jgi:hypothetical protein